ncbi:putative general negative regulator of transcription subunit 4 protein [Eutypa lata UCREL1]|uniref:Putative general negative regulator of transcription subunit 4 protein n=1 Tax=Eutypa lata (strain UCR-EL1) TaxID=1287681 RepID=M7SXW8_EUTLA|nr:putative general negative regulator of transcription subunit 4 protein [Eutypa lata UCREL1]
MPQRSISEIAGAAEKSKKKQKKEKKPSIASAAPSRPETPQGSRKNSSAAQVSGFGQPSDSSEIKDAITPSNISSAKAKEVKVSDSQSGPKSPSQVDTSIRLNESTKTTILTPDYVSHTPEMKQDQPIDEDLGDIPNITDVFRSLLDDGTLSDTENIHFFKSPPSYTQRADHRNNATVSLPPTLKTIVTKEDEEQLNAFKPVRKTVHGQPVLLTPNGDCLLNLSREEAAKFLELQDRLRADSARPTAFSAPRYAPASGFSLVKNRAVPNGTPSFFPAGPDNYPSDPVGKMHREEAISCINQHVLPSLNLTSYKTMGPNANFTKNVNLQQLAPWIYPSHEAAADGKMFGGRAGDEYGPGAPNGNSNSSVAHHIDSAYGSYDSSADGQQHVVGGGPAGGPAIGSTPLMSVEESETVLAQAKKQHDAIDKKFRQLQAKNRVRLVVRATFGLYAASSFLVAVVWAVRLALLAAFVLAASVVQAVLGFAAAVVGVLVVGGVV